jgi:hypothetical protein
MTFAAPPQHMAVSLRLTVPNTHKYSGGYASKSEAEAEPRWELFASAGKPEAFRYVLRRSRQLSLPLIRAVIAWR